MKINSLLGIVIFSAMLISCRNDRHDDDDEHDDNKTDTQSPSIDINTPTNAQIFSITDTIKINGLITENESLHEANIKITDLSSNATVYANFPLVHDLTSYTFSQMFFPNVTTHTSYNVLVEATDHAGNKTSKSVQVHIMP